MRYIRKEQIVTTICNQDVNDIDVVNSLLKNLRDNTVEFSLTVRKFFPSFSDYKVNFYSNVKVNNVNDNVVDFIIFDKSSITHLKNISFSDIVEINATTTISKILETKADITRWDFLDIVEE